MSALEAGDTGELCIDLKRKGSRDELSDHRSAGENCGQVCDQSQQLRGGRRMNAAPQTKEVERKPKATVIGSRPPPRSSVVLTRVIGRRCLTSGGRSDDQSRDLPHPLRPENESVSSGIDTVNFY